MSARNTNANTRAGRPISRERDVEDNRILAVIAYLWIFCLIPLLARRDSPYAQFHAKQGVVLAIAWFLVWVVGIIPLLGWLAFFFGSLVLVVVNLMAIIKAYSGEEWKIPYLHQYVKVLNL
jgi:uncharacterized membrane protein